VTVLNRVQTRTDSEVPSPDLADDSPGRRRKVPAGFAAVVTAVGVVHALVVATRYHVGSFDDDANYVMAARALARGAGLTAKLAGTGTPLVGVYPPGLPSILAPFARVWPHGLAPLRVLPFACFVAIFPLTWAFLGRRGVSDRARLAVLALLALNPVLATYATMVMPETAFVVLFLLLLLAVERWQRQPEVLTFAGLATVAAAAGLLWLKEAGLGIAVGVVAWLLLRRLWRKALVAAVGPALAFVPVIVARASVGIALIGSRYSNDLGSYQGSVAGRFTHMVPHALGGYVNNVLSLSVVGPVEGPLVVLQWSAALAIAVGFVVWVRRRPDVAAVAVAAYLAETLLYPYTNERRVILVLPVILAWYVLGTGVVIRALGALASRVGRGPRMAGLLAVAALILVALLPQFPRDYLLSVGQDTSHPAGSPYMAILHQLGQPSDVVETDYLWTTALFSGHATANGAYLAGCDPGAVVDAVRRDRAAFLLSAALNRPDLVPSPCLVPVLAAQPSAVLLYRSAPGLASVFELVGPGTGHPSLHDLIGATEPLSAMPVTLSAEPPSFEGDAPGLSFATATVDGVATFTWRLGGAPVTQVSLSAATTSGPTDSVTIELQGPNGQWRPAVSAPGPVGAGQRARYLLAPFPQAVTAAAVRVTVRGQGRAEVHDLHLL